MMCPLTHQASLIRHINFPCLGFGSVEQVRPSKISQAPLFDAPGTSSEGIAEINQAGTKRGLDGWKR